jgi:hypothetical protein
MENWLDVKVVDLDAIAGSAPQRRTKDISIVRKLPQHHQGHCRKP